jgi:16S rRNA (uracil1498-N3)-methyltransferase
MHTAYYPNIIAKNSIIELDSEESWHLVKVARIVNDEKIKVINGKGTIAEGIVKNGHHKSAQILITETESFIKPNQNLHLIVAPTKVNDRMEWMLEKAVELGLNELTIVITHRTERKKINIERLLKIALAAAKQSKNPWLIKINEPLDFTKFIKQGITCDAYIAHCQHDNERLELKNFNTQQNVCVLIGPEGDFTPEEIESALIYGYKPVKLTQNILRAETAAIYVCSIFAK